MSNSFITGLVYGIRKNNYFEGGIYGGRIFRNEQEAILKNKIKVCGNVSGNMLSATTTGEYNIYSGSKTLIGDISFDFVLDFHKTHIKKFDIVDKIFLQINTVLKENKGFLKRNSNYNSFSLLFPGKCFDIELDKNLTSTDHVKINYNNINVYMFIDEYLINITVNDYVWNIPANESYQLFELNFVQVHDEKIENSIQHIDYRNYDLVKSELENIYNDVSRGERNIKTLTRNEETAPLNNLYNIYYVRRYNVNPFLNLDLGIRAGLMVKVDPNETSETFVHVFTDAERNNVLNWEKQQYYATVSPPTDEGKQQIQQNDLSSYEKYNKYLFKVDITEKTQEEINEYISFYSIFYVFDIFRNENGEIYGLYAREHVKLSSRKIVPKFYIPHYLNH